MSDESNNVTGKGTIDPVVDSTVEEHSIADSFESVSIGTAKDVAALPEESAELPEEPKGPVEDGEMTGQEAVSDADENGADADAASDEDNGSEDSERDTVGAQESEELEEDSDNKKDWYILKVQSNRERSIAEALRRKIAIEGLEEYFGDVIVPTEKVTEFKGGKKKIVERKLYPGYIVVCMCINDDTWFAVRETSGIGDFTGSGGKPTPMLAHEVARIVHTDEEEHDEAPKLDIRFKLEDRVKIKEGTFEGFEGDVNDIDEASGRVTVIINIFSRSTPVELEYWQIESV